ncbi:retropepsin-like aspartic protease [Telmatobacter sp. DSM 110680]|uniref:Retropepsin-like aspartic protease n=1 Tax=Telmatobacter sp. DSM 110680 TaxID=3036704 RepID=A0AAU7DLR4_9BACT
MPAPGKVAFGFMLRCGCAFLLCFVVWSAYGQGPVPQSSAVQKSAVPSEVYSTPIELIHDKPYVSVMVNGRGPFRFLIDTGTGGQALITRELAEELLLPVTGHAHLTDASGLGEQRSETTWIGSLKLAGVEFSDVEAVVHNLYGDANCQGVLGFTLFEDYLLTLDFPGRRLTLMSGEIREDSDGSVLPFRMPDGVPIVHLKIGERQLDAQIDSGGTGLSVPQKDSAELKFQETPVAFATGESVSTRFEIKAARLQPDVRLGRYIFRHAFVEINAAFPLVNIGSTPLQHFIVTFDQINELVRLHSSEDTLRLDASPSTMQLLNEHQQQQSDNKLVPVG